MFCKHYRIKISESLDNGTELPAGTLKHIAKCKKCRQYYDNIKKLEVSLECEPELIPNYNFDKLNLAISSKIDLAEPLDTDSLHYPTIKYNHKFAIAATFIIAAALSFSIFVNSTTKIDRHTGNMANKSTNYIHSNVENTNSSKMNPQKVFTATPQMAIIYQISSLLDEKEVKSTILDGKEFYEKTQEISEKSYDIINKALKNSHLITLLF